MRRVVPFFVKNKNGTLVFSSLHSTERTPASLLTFNRDETGTVDRNVHDKLRDFVNIFDYLTAAQIADVESFTGSIDMSAIINAVITELSGVGGGTLYFPAGKYLINSSIIGESYVNLSCVSGETTPANNGTIFKWGGGNTGTMFSFINVRQVNFSGFCLDGQSGTAVVGILYTSTDGSSAECIFERFTIRECYQGVVWGDSDLAGGAWAAQAWFRTFTIWSGVANSVGFVLNSGNVSQQGGIEHGAIQTMWIGIDAQYSNMMTIRRVFGGGRMASAFIQVGYALGMIIDSCSSECWGAGSAVEWRHNDAYFLRVYQPAQGATSTNKSTITMLQNQINNPILIEQQYRIVSVGDNWGTCRDSVTEVDVQCTGTFTTDISSCVALNNGIWDDTNGYDATTGMPNMGWIDSVYVNLTNIDPSRDWKTPAFSAGDYTGSGGMGVTVAAGDVETYAYRISGKTMTVLFKINTITTIAPAGYVLSIKIPAGYVATKGVLTMCRVSSGATGVGFAAVGAGGTTIDIQPSDTTVWTIGVDNQYVQGQITFEVD
jgi:hypothetical protein